MEGMTYKRKPREKDKTIKGKKIEKTQRKEKGKKEKKFFTNWRTKLK